MLRRAHHRRVKRRRVDLGESGQGFQPGSAEGDERPEGGPRARAFDGCGDRITDARKHRRDRGRGPPCEIFSQSSCARLEDAFPSSYRAVRPGSSICKKHTPCLDNRGPSRICALLQHSCRVLRCPAGMRAQCPGQPEAGRRRGRRRWCRETLDAEEVGHKGTDDVGRVVLYVCVALSFLGKPRIHLHPRVVSR
jgi:hypothetical protein